jgi:acetyl esterase
MPLDPQAKGLLDQMEAMGAPPMHTLSVPDARQMMEGFIPLAGEPAVVANVEDRQIPGPAGEITVRVYTPEGAGPFPALVFYHGGGWVIGNIEVYDPTCRAIANNAGCVVVSVEYRLAPENKFPAAPEDCYAATKWVAENAASLNIDPERIAIGGDSAGGNLTAVVAQMARDQGGPNLVFQLLVYPVADHHSAGMSSYEENADGYLLTRDSMIWFWEHYLDNPDDKSHPLASPLQAKDFSNLPPALVITAEFDPLRDEGEAYAAKLKEAGVPVTLTRYNGMIHGFFMMMGVLDQAKKAHEEAAAALRSAFAPKASATSDQPVTSA